MRRNLEFQLDLMDATNVVVTTNVELRRNGRPYANQGSSDTGLAVYFTRKGCEQAIAATNGTRFATTSMRSPRASRRSEA